MKRNHALLAAICAGLATTAFALPPEVIEILDRNEANMRAKLSAQYVVETEEYKFDPSGERTLYLTGTTVCDHADGAFSRVLTYDRHSPSITPRTIRFAALRTKESGMYTRPLIGDVIGAFESLVVANDSGGASEWNDGRPALNQCVSDLLTSSAASESGMELRRYFEKLEKTGWNLTVAHESSLDGNTVTISTRYSLSEQDRTVLVFTADDQARLLGTYRYDTNSNPVSERRIEYKAVDGQLLPWIETTTIYRANATTGDREPESYRIQKMASFTPTTGRTAQEIADAFGLVPGGNEAHPIAMFSSSVFPGVKVSKLIRISAEDWNQ